MINRYFTFGYGFEVDVIGSINALSSYRFHHEDETADNELSHELDDIEYFLEQKFPLLKTFHSGDNVNDDPKSRKQWVFIKESVVDLWVGFNKDFSMDNIRQAARSDEALAQLFEFCAYTGVAVGNPGWFFLQGRG